MHPPYDSRFRRCPAAEGRAARSWGPNTSPPQRRGCPGGGGGGRYVSLLPHGPAEVLAHVQQHGGAGAADPTQAPADEQQQGDALQVRAAVRCPARWQRLYANIHRVDPVFSSRPGSLSGNPYQRLLQLTQSMGQPCEVSLSDTAWVLCTGPGRRRGDLPEAALVVLRALEAAVRGASPRPISTGSLRGLYGGSRREPGGGGSSRRTAMKNPQRVCYLPRSILTGSQDPC
jgi:hypothetical protein